MSNFRIFYAHTDIGPLAAKATWPRLHHQISTPGAVIDSLNGECFFFIFLFIADGTSLTTIACRMVAVTVRELVTV